MAQVDTSIYRFRVPQIASPADIEERRLGIEAARQANALREQQAQFASEDRQRAQQTSARRNALLGQYEGEALERALRQQGFLDDAEKLETSRLNRDKTKAETQEKRRATKDKETERNVALLRNVRDQGTYTMLRNLIELEDGPEAVRTLPEEYNPQIIEAMLNRYVPQQAVVEDQRARDLARMTDARTRQEGAANRAVTVRGQDMTDARQRELAQIQREGQRATADEKKVEADKKAQQRAATLSAGARNVLDAVTEAKGMVGLTTAGPGALTAGIPMTPARDLRAKLETIKGNLGFDRLQQMRDMSPTGGALGQVAVQELIALQSTVASLDQAQSPAQLSDALEKIERHYNNWLATLEGRTPNAGGPTGAPPSGAIDLLRQNPALAPQFDAKYGQGAAARVLGGR